MDPIPDVPKVTRADVLRIVQRDFRPEDRERVLDLLAQYSAEPSPDGHARVHLAILKLSDGSVDRVQQQVAVAQEDFRDVICPAEYPEFSEVGFVGVARMTGEEVGNLRARDWHQYHQWLNRK